MYKQEIKMKFRPLHDRVLIKVLDSEEKTAGGIIIPDTAKEKPQEGEVVAVASASRSTSEIPSIETGEVARPHTVLMPSETYPRKWQGGPNQLNS